MSPVHGTVDEQYEGLLLGMITELRSALKKFVFIAVTGDDGVTYTRCRNCSRNNHDAPNEPIVHTPDCVIPRLLE